MKQQRPEGRKASVWQDTVRLPEFPKPEGDLHTEVLIIGGGLAGLLCALRLQEAGADYALVEANRICGGITKNTTAKITSQHGFLYDKLIRRFGKETAQSYLLANEAAVADYRRLCRDIDCDFETRDNVVYTVKDWGKAERELIALRSLGIPAQAADCGSLPFPVAGGVRFPNQAQFHPLKFVSAIAGKLNIFEHTKVRELQGMTAVTDSGRITAEKILIATHFPILNKHGLYFLKLYQHRSYVLGLEGAKAVDGMYVDESGSGLSFRNAGSLLLLGGGGHRTGKPGGGWKELEDFARQHYPKARFRCRWAAQDCMSLDGVPYIGQYSPGTPGLYVASGFNKWGMTSAMVSAAILTDLLQGKQNPYAAVFSPSRSLLRPQLAVNAAESAVSLLTPTAKRCPHMGCALKWNPEECSWDCPCHGSRFASDGSLIDNPATADHKGDFSR